MTAGLGRLLVQTITGLCDSKMKALLVKETLLFKAGVHKILPFLLK